MRVNPDPAPNRDNHSAGVIQKYSRALRMAEGFSFNAWSILA
jgi:hypothetical protein